MNPKPTDGPPPLRVPVGDAAGASPANADDLYERVKSAAMSLIADGISPTPSLLRRRLRFPIDAELLASLFRRWQTDLRQTPQQALPDEVPAALHDALATLWRSARDEAAERFAALRRRADADLADATAHRVETLAELEQQKARAGALCARLDAAERRRVAADKQLAVEEQKRLHAETLQQHLQHQLDAARDARRQAGETQLAQLDALRADAESRRRADAVELSELRLQLRQQRQRADAAEHALATLREQHQQTHARVAVLATQLRERERELKQRRRDDDASRHRLEQYQNRLGRLQVERDAGRERLARAETQLRRLRGCAAVPDPAVDAADALNGVVNAPPH